MNKLYEKFRINTDKTILSVGQKLCKITNGTFPKMMFSETVKAEYVGTNVKILSEDEDSVTIAKVDAEGKIMNDGFRILSSTDFHFGDDNKLRDKCMDMFVKQIKATMPDLVVLTGDIIQSKYQHFDAIQFGQFMEKIGVYWTFVFGNHEAREEKGDFKYLLMKCKTIFPHCLARQGKPDLFGYGNYCVNIMKSENEVLKTLFMFDSGRNIISEYAVEHGLSADTKGYDFLKNNQLDWYKEKICSLREKYGEVKSFMYMHIPLKEYENAIALDEYERWVFTDKCKILYGSVFESVGCSPYNSGMFDLIKELNSTQAVFAGHDHVNDFCALYDGIYLVYNQYNGYETYTMDDKQGWKEKDWMQGVTITDVFPDGSFDISPRYNSMYL